MLYLMLGKYTLEGLKGAKAARTKKVMEFIKKESGRVIGSYALIGTYDLALIVDLPSNEALVKVSTEITKLTGVGFSTSPAMSVEEFDKIVG